MSRSRASYGAIPRLCCCSERHKPITETTAMRLLPHNRELSHQVCRFVKFALPHLSHIWFSAPHSNLELFFFPFPQPQPRTSSNINTPFEFDLPRSTSKPCLQYQPNTTTPNHSSWLAVASPGTRKQPSISSSASSKMLASAA
jgi:hypothetical protein